MFSNRAPVTMTDWGPSKFPNVEKSRNMEVWVSFFWFVLRSKVKTVALEFSLETRKMDFSTFVFLVGILLCSVMALAVTGDYEEKALACVIISKLILYSKGNPIRHIKLRWTKYERANNFHARFGGREKKSFSLPFFGGRENKKTLRYKYGHTDR